MNVPLPLVRAEDVKKRADLVAIASGYTSLRRVGQQFVGLCPFHSERHPSFYVHPVKRLFKCFGCDAGGDVFNFIMRVEKFDFLEALRFVAEFSLGIADASGLRSSPRFGSGVRVKPLKPAKQATVNSPDIRSALLARLSATDERLRKTYATNQADSAALATACEPERE
jgi:CHC2 zinc finger